MKVLVAGVAGKMGRAITAGIIDDDAMTVVGAVDVNGSGDLSRYIGGEIRQVAVTDDLAAAIERCRPDVVLDFTNPQAVRKNVEIALRARVDMVIGTTGLIGDDLSELHRKALRAGVRLFVVPNFALGAILMMQFAAEAAKYFHHVEIIELHHDQKMDAPSGTAIKTLEMITQNRPSFKQGNEDEFEKIAGSRGGEFEGMRVHSVRLPGYVGHQEVIFGAPGQVLTIRHDAMSRDSYVPGVLLALSAIEKLEDGLTYGLETIL